MVIKVKAKNEICLPVEKSIPSEKLYDYTWLIYGAKKIGKTSLAAQFGEKSLFFMFEQGAKSLSVYQVNCNTWDNTLKYLDLLEKQKENGTLKYNTIVIDTAFEAYQRCFDYVCKREKIEYPREDNFGKDWKKISNEFNSFQQRILGLNIGMVVLCHETKKEETTFSGQKFDMVMPNLPKAIDSIYRAQIDNVVWYHYRGKDRFLTIKGSDYALAGIAAQVDKKFCTPKGEPIFAIPMGNSPSEGFKNLNKAFNNLQNQTFKEETERQEKSLIAQSITEKIKKQSKKRS